MIIDLKYEGKFFTGIDTASDNSMSVLSDYHVPRDVIDAAILNAKILECHNARKIAYTLESDPLYMEWQYDQTTEKEQAWRNKVAEIKQRYPLPAVE